MPGLSSDLVPFWIKTLPGENSKGDPLEFEDKFVLTAQNCKFDPEPGGVSKRDPLYYFNSVTTSSLPVVGLYRYYKSDGTAMFIKVSGTVVEAGSDTTETFSTIRSGMTTGKRMSFVTYKDLLIGSNGYNNPFVYDGNAQNVTWELGACKNWTGTTQANMTVGSVTYQVTIDNDAYVCGAVSNTVTTTGCAYSLSNIPLGPTGTVNRKIYRKDSITGSDYKLVGTISDNTTTTYTDASTTTSATTIPSVTDDMPLGAELQLYKERLFVGRDPSNPNRIYFSNVYLPHYIQQTSNSDYMDISPNDNDEIAGIPVFLGTMVCIKKNTIRKLYISGPQEQWYAEDPFVHAGSPAPWSICPTPYGIAYLGWDHWYMFDGANSNPIIDEFDTYDILEANYNDTITFFHENELLAAYTVLARAQSYHDRLMRYNFKRKALAHDLLTVNCFTAKRGDDESGEIYFGDSVYDYVYKGTQEDLVYKISTKNDCNTGVSTDVYVGGTESNPYLEIGNSVTASNLPTGLVILWDSDTAPGDGWTEITSNADGRYIRTGTTYNVTGNVGVTISEAAQVTTEATAVSFIRLKAYAKNSTGSNVLPTGAILMWDQSEIPEGFESLGGYYVQLSSTSVGSTGTDQMYSSGSGTGSSIDNALSINLIKKIGEQSTWDGSTKYAYCLGNVTINSNGWSEASATYNNLFLYADIVNLTENRGGDTEYPVNLLVRADTTHSYEQNFTSNSGTVALNSWNDGDGSLGIDEDFDTYNGDFRSSASYGQGASNWNTMKSTHVFDRPQTVTGIKYRMYARGYNSGDYFQEHHYYLKVQYSTNSVGWTTFTAASYSGSGGGNSDTSIDTGTVTGNQTIANVEAVRMIGNITAGCAQGAWGEYLRFYDLAVYAKPYPYVTFPITRKILGKLNSYNGSWDTNSVTAGTWTSSVAQINASSLLKLYWNESLTGTDNALFYFRTGSTAAACTGASWSTAYSDPNGVSIAGITADVFAQFKVVLSATNTTVSNPKVYATDGYVVKYTYSKGGTAAESSVEFIYELGFRHFDEPLLDKIFKKIQLEHEGSVGSFTVYWDTENTTSGSFTISLADFPKRWNSFFPDDAFGKQMNIKVYKNDLNSFKLKEIGGVYTPEPLII